MNDFEKVLAKELIESLTNYTELWKLSSAGLKREDELELFVFLENIYVYRPYVYKFKDDIIKKELYKVADKLRKSLYQDQDTKNEIENKNKLAKFLNLNTRKNKLQHLNETVEIPEIVEIPKEAPKESIFKRLFSFF